jgi:hypothetical protein
LESERDSIKKSEQRAHILSLVAFRESVLARHRRLPRESATRHSRWLPLGEHSMTWHSHEQKRMQAKCRPSLPKTERASPAHTATTHHYFFYHHVRKAQCMAPIKAPLPEHALGYVFQKYWTFTNHCLKIFKTIRRLIAETCYFIRLFFKKFPYLTPTITSRHQEVLILTASTQKLKTFHQCKRM